MGSSESTKLREELLFVYGSLKRGFNLHHLLAGAEFVQDALTLPRYRLFDCGEYPALVPSPDHGYSIAGEVYRVTLEQLRILDEAEGVEEGLYTRSQVQLLGRLSERYVHGYEYLKSIHGLKECRGRWPS
ncbi:MAG: gamma-glutamylcyclotransferase [Planctomycetaceae bacterium]|nr:gamma-glutamylcyclotransferase [Planctomycetaceae bacterium]